MAEVLHKLMPSKSARPEQILVKEKIGVKRVVVVCDRNCFEKQYKEMCAKPKKKAIRNKPFQQSLTQAYQTISSTSISNRT